MGALLALTGDLGSPVFQNGITNGVTKARKMHLTEIDVIGPQGME